MIDTLLTIALVTLPTTRPNMEREVKIIAPVAVQLVRTTPRREEEATKLSTCYQNAYSSCWSED